ncbi:MAG: cupin domain-containing protein [Eubacterium sp.]|jgi:mannose-6-phosphate isomerase-like protein (cupin superfamily)|nr:cupin domain-containing protein [Eubacterium sp.]
MKALSDQTGLSIGYLSNVERNITSPTILNLQKICEALHTSLGDLVTRPEENGIVIRAKDRRQTIDENHNIHILTMDFGLSEGYSLLMINDPRSPYSSFEGTEWTHGFTEVGYVVSGRIRVVINSTAYDLEQGDSILIRENAPHKVYNLSTTEKVVTYWTRYQKRTDEQ